MTKLTVLVVASGIFVVLAADMQPTGAQESFFNDRYCTRGRGDALLDCGYSTWEQCIETARGLGRFCMQNPFWHGPVANRVETLPRSTIPRNIVAAAHARPAAANESFWNDRYCTRGKGGVGLDCGYNTWQQCIETARGLGRFCIENPFWHASVSNRSRP